MIRPEVAVRPDRARDLAGPDLVDRLGQPAPAAIDLERPAGELEPERRRLGVDASGSGPSSRSRPRLGPGRSTPRGADRSPRAAARPAARSWRARRRVDDVAARQPEVEVAALGPDGLGDLADERDDVVVGRPLDLGDPLGVDAGASPRSPPAPRRGRGRGRPGPARRRARPGASARSGPHPSRSRPSPAACSGGSSGGSGGHRCRGRDVVPALHAGPRDDVSPRARRRRARRRGPRPRPTTARTRPPFVAKRTVRPRRVPAWKTRAPVPRPRRARRSRRRRPVRSGR